MAGGQPESESTPDWQVNEATGMLQGWGAPVAAPTRQPASGSADTEMPQQESSMSENKVEEQGIDDDSDDEDLDADVKKLQALLADNAAFFEACEAAIAKLSINGPAVVPGSVVIHTVEQLRSALTHICELCAVEEVDEEEALDLWEGPMDSGVFYQYAKEYFSSLCRTLLMDAHQLPDVPDVPEDANS
eukprot:TRINITY_DN70108_c0_g1_i1.p1 TRINITY_DN70108_c0_g1~~TRINITY_DN70108_c0_g1_i1.p1  ORF type:complete len:202 (-),score=57.67 TRINITY_DN70108_c0_g1_i1:79-645(-)